MTVKDTPLVSVVLSLYNEEETIPELIERLTTVFARTPYDYELVFVNDASTDRSLNLLEGHCGRDPHIKVLNMSRNFGVSQCAMAGFEHASGDAVIVMDADLQDPPEVIPELIEQWRQGADVVYTVRTDRAGESPIKLWVTKLAYRVLHFTSDIELPIEAGDFKLLSRRVVDELVRLREKDPFLRGLVHWVGFRQVPVYYRREKRFAGQSHFHFYGRRVILTFLSGVTSFSLAPLYAALVLGFLVSSGAFLYLLAVLWMKYAGWNLPGWSAIMATTLFLGGTQLLTIGVLGLYVGTIYKEVKRRPNYIVESKVGFDSNG